MTGKPLKGQCITILKSFSKKEIKQFVEFVKCRYHNRDEKLIFLSEFIQKQHNKLTEGKLTSEEVYTVIFGNKLFDRKKVQGLIKKLGKLVRTFVQIEFLKSDKEAQDELFWSALEERKDERIDQELNKELDKKINTITNKADKETNDYYRLFFWEKFRHSFHISRKGKLPNNTNLKAVIGDLDHYYHVERMRFACCIINRDIIFTKEEVSTKKDELLNHLLSYFNSISLNSDPVLNIYVHLYILMSSIKNGKREVEKKMLDHLKQLLKAPRLQISRNELLNICTLLINYYGQKYNVNKACKALDKSKDALEAYFYWYQFAFEQGIFLKDGFIIPLQHFRNIVLAALRLNKLNWIDHFIVDHLAYIQPKDKNDILVNFTLAEIAFYKAQYKKALAVVRSINKGKTYSTNTAIRCLEIKVLFELDVLGDLEFLEDVDIENTIHAFESYLNRHKIYLGNELIANRNFIIILKKIIDKKDNPNCKITKVDLLALMDQMNCIEELEWLKAKIGLFF